jgi:hypothetical protein
MGTPEQIRQWWTNHWQAEAAKNQRWADEATSPEWRDLYQRIANGYDRRADADRARLAQLQGAA